MARETKAQKAARVGALLAEYDDVNSTLNKLMSRSKELKAQIIGTDDAAGIDAGEYGDWVLSFGKPRVLFDQKGAKTALTEAGIPIPTTMSRPAIIVTSKHAQ